MLAQGLIHACISPGCAAVIPLISIALREAGAKREKCFFLIDTPSPCVKEFMAHQSLTHYSLPWSISRNLASKWEKQYKQSVFPKISLKSYFHRNLSQIFLSDKSKMVLSVQLSARCKWHKWMITLNTSSLRRELWDLTKASSCDYFQEITWK